MKVAIISHLFPSRKRPHTGIFVADQARALARRGIDVVVLSPQYARGAESPKGIGLPVRYGYLPWRNWLPSAANVLLAAYSYRKWIVKCLKDVRPDVVHAHYGFPDGVACIYAARSLGLPVVVTLHGSDVNYQLQRRIFGGVIASKLAKADAVLCVSQSLRRLIQKKSPELAQRAVCVPNGYDSQHVGFAEATLRDRIVFIGNLVTVKNPDILIEAYALITDSVGFPLEIIGDGVMKASLQDRVHVLGLGDRIRFHGAVPHELVGDLLKRAVALVLPSRSEGMPVVAVEALASGTPVVATRVGALPEMIIEGRNGLLVEPGDVSGLAKAILQAARLPWERKNIAEGMGILSWDEVAVRLSVIYREIVEDAS